MSSRANLPHISALREGSCSGAAASCEEKMTADSSRNTRPLRVLVAIASYGQKNIEFLRTIIRKYRSMSFEIDAVVVSEAPKDLGPEVEVVVGLPSRNPWSLPFAHKAVFAQSLEEYDFFVYSEDDMEVTEKNLRAFLAVTPQLAPDEIAGYLRYEADGSGNRYLPDAHGSFHWKPESVRKRGEEWVAEFTNEHAGFYVLTQAQLRRAVASGGYLRGPHRGRYNWPETAATDIYTGCGFRKVICLSQLDDFFIHHMSNRYVGKTGIPRAVFAEQVRTLMDVGRGVHPATTLCEVESRVPDRKWSKRYDEDACDEVLTMVGTKTKTALCVGFGGAGTEIALVARGCKVTGLPLDSVVGGVAERRGIEVVYGTMAEGLRNLKGREFDCVLLTNLLHLLPQPWETLSDCAKLVREGGVLIVTGPNFGRIPTLVRRALQLGDYQRLGDFTRSGIHLHSAGLVKRQIKRMGLRVSGFQWINHRCPRGFIKLVGGLRRFMARDWVLQATRGGS
jgi:SAM-dependent methyltransferase